MTSPPKAAPLVGKTSIEELAARGGIASEHVVLSGGAEDEQFMEPRSMAVRQRIQLHNPVRRNHIDLRVFKDGYLSVVERGGDRRAPERTVDLRFIDPSPKLSRRVDDRSARIALGSFGAACVLAALSFVLPWPAALGLLAVVAVAAAVGATLRFLTQTYETVEFRTKTGRVVVLALIANVGCQRAYRAAVPELVAAIRHANGKLSGDRQTTLRSEIREHYRLARTRVIDKQSCERATSEILSEF